VVILNPASRSGATGRRFAEVEARLRERLGALDVERTRGPRDAERIAREAVRTGAERIVVAGGDGTVSEVVTGLLAAGLAGEVELGLLPLGSGGDLLRTLGVPRDLDAAVDGLVGGPLRHLDAGRLEYRGRDGAPRRAFFLNVASFGISGLVDELVNRAPKTLGGTAAFAAGALRAILRYRPVPVSLRLDGQRLHEGPLTLAAAANGRFFGGGMRIAPDARPDDGMLDVVVVKGQSRLRLLANFPSIYRGSHVEHPDVRVRRGRRLEADAEPGRVWLDVDGEPLGTLPAVLEILPGAIAVRGGSPASDGA